LETENKRFHQLNMDKLNKKLNKEVKEARGDEVIGVEEGRL